MTRVLIMKFLVVMMFPLNGLSLEELTPKHTMEERRQDLRGIWNSKRWLALKLVNTG